MSDVGLNLPDCPALTRQLLSASQTPERGAVRMHLAHMARPGWDCLTHKNCTHAMPRV